MIRLTATCENGHTQEINFGPGITREWADGYAGLLDGTSPMYVYSPIGTPSVIGKCGICGSQIKCEVTEG